MEGSALGQWDPDIEFVGGLKVLLQLNDKYEYIQIGEDQRFIGFYGVVRSPRPLLSEGLAGIIGIPGSGDLIDSSLNMGGDNQPADPPRKEIAALGVVVFDKGNPRCASHPTPEEQYLYEWAFAHLDLNGNTALDQTELQVLKSTVPEVGPYVSTDAVYDMEFFTFVDLMRHREVVEADGLTTLREYLL